MQLNYKSMAKETGSWFIAGITEASALPTTYGQVVCIQYKGWEEACLSTFTLAVMVSSATINYCPSAMCHPVLEAAEYELKPL